MRRYNYGQDGKVGIQGYANGVFYRNWFPAESSGALDPLRERHERARTKGGGRDAKERSGGFNVDSNWAKSQEESKQGWKEKNQRKQGREDQMFQMALERMQREHEAGLNAQEQQRKMKMLSGLMGGNRGGFEEQIFNNAGAPQVVRLNKDNSTQMAQIIAQMLGR